MKGTSRPLAAVLVGLLVLNGAAPLTAQDVPPPAPAAAPAPPTFKPEEIEQIVAPIALYPDPLLAQVLMASTYPLEIVEAARWRKQNPDLKDTALENALQQQTWDPAVKSLTAFPDVLTMMNEELPWTQKLGDAFLAQQKDVMDAVQTLRAKAKAAGNLESNEQQKVIVEPAAPVNVQQNVTVQQPEGAPAPAPAPPTVIKIEQANPQVVYVPTYSPAVYGPWPYPAYPPYSYYPPGYVAGTALLSFGVGMAVGAAVWGNCNWGHGDVNINTTNYNNFNKTNIANGNWQHNVDHRKGVQYRDNATRQKYNRGGQGNVQSREAFRGRAEQGRQQIARGAASDYRGSGGRPTDRGGRQGSQGPAATQRGAGQGRTTAAQRDVGGGRAPAQPQRQAAQARDTGGRNPAAFQGVGNGQQTRAQSDRGRASRQNAAAFGGGAGARPGGGGGGFGGGRAGGGGGGGARGGGGGGRRR